PPRRSTLSLHDALPIFAVPFLGQKVAERDALGVGTGEERRRAAIEACNRREQTQMGDANEIAALREEAARPAAAVLEPRAGAGQDRKSTRLNSSHVKIS